VGRALKKGSGEDVLVGKRKNVKLRPLRTARPNHGRKMGTEWADRTDLRGGKGCQGELPRIGDAATKSGKTGARGKTVSGGRRGKKQKGKKRRAGHGGKGPENEGGL